jgi:lipopolysaccharide/colanic/teichoic acid biosynthesis glycosyltransferase
MRELAEAVPRRFGGGDPAAPCAGTQEVTWADDALAPRPKESPPEQAAPFDFAAAYPHLSEAGWLDLPLVDPRVSVRSRLWAASKRVADVAVSAVLLVVLLPFLALVGLIIRLESSGPALFSQDRVGKCGRIFRIYKFRTMVADAFVHEAEVVCECQGDPRFIKIECDPRVTRIGAFLRKTSIDELPQLWNVLRGDMSLVGPRPSQPKEVAHYEPGHYARLLVRPGVTGMWQVSGRSALSFDDAVELDKKYVQHWSPVLDLKILVKTVAVVLECDGAC